MTAQKVATTKTRPLPGDLADLALLTVGDVCALLRMSTSWFLEEVRCGRAPQPLRFGPRCSRWKAAEVRAYLIQRAQQPTADTSLVLVERAKRASLAAAAKRGGVVAP